MTKLVKTDHTVDAASNFTARLTQMLGARSTENVPAIVRPVPTGKKLFFTVGEHIANLYAVHKVTARNGKPAVVFEMEVVESTSMPVLGRVEYIMFAESLFEVERVRSALEATGTLDEFLANSTADGFSCSKRLAVSCVEKLMKNGRKTMIVKPRVIDA